MDRTPAVVKMDPPALTRPAAAAPEGPAPAARRLVEASVSPNTRRAYSGALRRLDAWLAARRLEDATLAAVLATCHRPRRRGRSVESGDVALKRGRLDAVVAGLLFMAGLRRSEVSALLWGDVAEAAAGDGMLVTVRRGKTNPEGEARDVRFVS